jgi:hypothetical protein
MRHLILASIAALSVALPAFASDPPVFSQRPTEEYLRQLDNAQLRLVRRAVQGCPSSTTGRAVIRPERNPCVTSATDKSVAEAGDADLQAFHDGLRPTDRYDETRTSAAWINWRVAN